MNYACPLFYIWNFCFTGSIKRKVRRRSIWERGIIRKKKSNKKEEIEDDDEPEEDEGPDDSIVAGQGHASPAQDESSSDTAEPQPDQPLPQPNGYALSTEEENSSEATATQDPQGQDKATTTFKNPPSGEEKEAAALSEPKACVNGDESMDSIDSEANEKESGSSNEELTASVREYQAGLEDTVEEGKSNDCTPAGDGAASDEVHEKEGTVLSSGSNVGGLYKYQIKHLIILFYYL